MEAWIEQAVETWHINNRVNLYLLEAISPEALSGMLPLARTRTVARMFVHISHEAYHRGEICVALTESGHKLDDAVLYGQWEWSKR